MKNLCVEAAVTLRNVLPISILVKEAVIEHIPALDSITTFPLGLVPSPIRVN